MGVAGVYLILKEHGVLQVDFWDLLLEGVAGQLKGKVKRAGDEADRKSKVINNTDSRAL